MTDTRVAQQVQFEAVDTLPRHRDAAFTAIRRRAQTDGRLMRAMIRAQHALTSTEHWLDRRGVFHVQSATNPHADPYTVDVLGACSCPAHGLCWHQVAR